MKRIKLHGDPGRATRAAQILRAVAHPVRLRIVAALCERELHVSALSELLGLKQAIISQQLRILRMEKLVGVRRENGFAHYSLTEPHLRDLVRCAERCCATA